MPLTRPYDDTIRERAQCDPEFRRLLTTGAIEDLLTGDVAVGKIRLRHTVNSTIGYEKLGNLMKRSPESIKDMLHPDYDTSVNDLFEIIKHIQQHEGIRLEVKVCSGKPDCESAAHDEPASQPVRGEPVEPHQHPEKVPTQ